MGPRRDTRWWGWGDADEGGELSPAAEAMLNEREILPDEAPELPPLDSVSIPEARELPEEIGRIVGEGNLFTGHEDRVRHSSGQSYLDLLEKRSGQIGQAPDAVVVLPSSDAIVPLLEACSRLGIAVVPFGGGTSVVGGVAPIRGEFERLISVDTVNLRSVEIDEKSLTATVGAGLRGPEAEALLGASGYTIGHFPQSFEYATIGGFAAARSAGQSSSGYGRFDSLVSSIRMGTPAGEISTLRTPHTAIGPSLREMIVGSEGIFGIIPDVDVRIRPAPEAKRYEGWIAGSFAEGNEIVRGLVQSDSAPTIARVSDESETEVSLTMSAPGGIAGDLFRRYLKVRDRSGGALMIVGFEGTADEVRAQRAVTARALRKGGAVYLGQTAGRGWQKGRFHGPYLRESLMDRGVLVETLETAQQWSAHPDLYRGVKSALEAAMASQGMKGIVMCHLSHAYRDGASLYFTVISSPGTDGGAASWPVVKRAACEAIQAAGGTLSHHHATGRDHAPYVAAEIGDLGIEALLGVKERLDPAGIMNPGKLITG
ncbi:MAG TPA: FAD-binding oxidoreductase [Solirubrobacterales bacterium]|nr:FAD-binding oxidoreductase [Solirubrobacterales bacterium]